MKMLTRICKLLLSAVVAVAAALGTMCLTDNDGTVLGVYFVTALGVALFLGVFDVEERKSTRYESIEHAARRMREAA